MIDAPADTPLSFSVTNDGAAQHSFAVLAGDQTYETPLLDGGASATLDVPALPQGDYVTQCTAPGHADAGMKGMLMVSAAELAGGPASPSTSTTMSAEEMADAHQASVEAFVAQLTDGPNTRASAVGRLSPR